MNTPVAPEKVSTNMTENDKQTQDVAAQAEDAEDLVATQVISEQAAEAAGSDEDPLATAQALAAENWNKYLRAVAELDNVRKRASRDVEKARRYGIEGLAQALLEVADSLEMALEAGEQASAESLLEGSQATLKQLQKTLESHGVAGIYPEGEPFDPELHEAMTMVESDSAEPNSVVTVVQRGYQLNGRLLRPARVVVAKEPSSAG
jgi:molecular chaperone GrpE